MRRRAFFRRLATGLAAVYASPGVLEGLAAAAPVQHGRDGTVETMAELLRKHYLPGIVAQFDAEFPLMRFIRANDASREADEFDGEAAMIFPVDTVAANEYRYESGAG